MRLQVTTGAWVEFLSNSYDSEQLIFTPFSPVTTTCVLLLHIAFSFYVISRQSGFIGLRNGFQGLQNISKSNP